MREEKYMVEIQGFDLRPQLCPMLVDTNFIVWVILKNIQLALNR